MDIKSKIESLLFISVKPLTVTELVKRTEAKKDEVKSAIIELQEKYNKPNSGISVQTIEDKVQIGSHCSIYSVSTIDDKEGKVILKKNCKIGSHSVIMPGVSVGENSIIGAFSFVNKNIPDNVIAFGIPVKVIKKIK